MRFESDVVRGEAGPVRLYSLRTGVAQVVTVRGSLPARPGVEQTIQDLLVSVLDKGTRRRDRFEVADVLENRGAVIGFSSDGLSVGFSARCLKEDLRTVLDLLAEQLLIPRLDPDEIDKARTQMVGAVRRSMDHTGHRAGCLLSAACYSPDHPNFLPEPIDEVAALERVTTADLTAYHRRMSDASPLMVVVGDIDPVGVNRDVTAAFQDWRGASAEEEASASALEPVAGRSAVRLADKQNIDVRLGHPIRIRRSDPEFLALHVGNFVFGGNFSARLMSVVRDQMGLTYGIGSNLAGVSNHCEGTWRTHVTLSGPNLDKGIAATLNEARRLVQDGVSEDEVAEKAETIAGSFQVRLATTGGLAGNILSVLNEGFGLDYLDTFCDRVRAIRAVDANDAIRKHLQPDRLHIATAGTTT